MLARATRQLTTNTLKASVRSRAPVLCCVIRNVSIGKSPVSVFNRLFPFLHPKLSLFYSQYKHGHHRSNAEELINKVPVIEVEGECSSGSHM